MSIFMTASNNAIRAVSVRTGLSAHVIRVWEKRYGAVQPNRSGTNRRYYSEEQIERLVLLRDLAQAGHSIGTIAKLETEELRRMASQISRESGFAAGASSAASEAEPFLAECIATVKALNAGALEDVLKRTATVLGAQGLLQRVVAPLAQRIGDLWREGSITAAHEHFASAVIRVFLGHAARTFASAEDGPVLVVATPSGQLHELGALLVGASAANLGWRVTYLGASLPAAEIAGAARQHRAKAVALSLVYPEDDPRLEGELERLRELLPEETVLLTGGRASPAYRKPLKQIGALQIKDLTHLGAVLDELRQPVKEPNP